MFGLLDDFFSVLAGDKDPVEFVTDTASDIIATPIKLVTDTAGKVVRKVIE